MSVAIDPTVSGAASNSYSSVVDGDTYFATQLFASAWTSETNADRKAQALITMTATIDLQQYQGDQAVLTQRLKFPRTYILQPFDPGIVVPPGAMPPGGYVPMPRYYPSDIIIQPVLEACWEGANILLGATSDPLGEDVSLQIKSEQLGPISTTYADPAQRARGIWRFPKIVERLAPLMLASRQTRVRRA